MRAETGAADRVAPAGTAGHTTDDAPSIAEPAEQRKQPNFGACIGCGIRIAPSSGTLRCPTCAAWRRWFSAHRIASRALREASR